MTALQTRQVTIPTPSRWGINAFAGGRPVVWGELNIYSIETNGRFTGTVNFRGTPIPIEGFWNSGSGQISFSSPYARFIGTLSNYDDPAIRTRHYVLNGSLLMMPPSIQAGERGTWIATTNTCLTQQEQGAPASIGLPPVGVFVTADYTGNPC
ncbi:hypothetical protein [Paenibacillus sp. OAS669]|uniref:hypothetical protein n=1 Tax=Paenibacillus sp. OAS669 TaxID=2663821 RepID=UPI0039A1F8E4